MGLNVSSDIGCFSSLSGTPKKISKRDVQIIKRSWKDLNEVGDFKTHGVNMMIRYISLVRMMKFYFFSFMKIKISIAILNHFNDIVK